MTVTADILHNETGMLLGAWSGDDIPAPGFPLMFEGAKFKVVVAKVIGDQDVIYVERFDDA